MSNLVLSTACGKWVHANSTNKKKIAVYLNKSFNCKKCKSVVKNFKGPDVMQCDDVDTASKFSYLGDRLNANGGCETALTARASKRGAWGTMTMGLMEFRGLMGLRGPIRWPNGFIGPIEMTLTNQFVKDLFFFGDHIKIPRKLCHFALKTFFLSSHQKSEKIVAFSLFVLENTKPEMPNI